MRKAVFRPDLYDAALGGSPPPLECEPRDGIGAFVGPDFLPGRHRGPSRRLAAQAGGEAAAVDRALIFALHKFFAACAGDGQSAGSYRIASSNIRY